MAKVLITDSYLTAIAGAIRTKKGTSVTYEPSEMASAINSIVTYPEPTGTKSITSNGSNIDVKDYASANVNVPNSYSAGDEGKVVRSGALVSQSSTTKNANGTYDTTLNNQVVVNVANSYSAGDEGKVVSNGALVSQGSQTITQNGTYDTTLISELIANISGGGGGSISINDYVFNYTPTVVATGSMSAGFAFTVSKKIKASKIRVFATEAIVSAHLAKDGTDVASVLDATVTANQWNDINLPNPVILEPNATYIVWHSHKTQHPRALGSVPAYRVPFITYLNSVYATTADTYPTQTESRSLIGVDLYVDSIVADEGGGAKNILSGTSAPSGGQGSDGNIYLQYIDETLPSGYTKLEYIQFANGTYINTGAAATNHLIEMKVNDLSYTNDKHWFGNPNSNYYPHFTTYSNKYYWGTNGSSESSGGNWGAGEHILEFNKGSNHEIVLDNVIIGSGTNISTTYNIVIGSRQGTANANNLRVYYFRMYDRENDVYVRNLVPAKDSNNVIGLYDLVNNVFYDNDGSGSFTAGPDAVLDEPITTTYLKVNGTWQQLIGSDIDDVNTGGGEQ